ncbi:TPA: hypothetical protein QDB50_000516 [Burkholderia vietnamiensis]|nr:hypothetical protein [Burkholderia vietnamiensis]
MANTHKQPMVRVTVDMTPDMHAALREQCEKEDFTMAQYLRRLVRAALDEKQAPGGIKLRPVAERVAEAKALMRDWEERKEAERIAHEELKKGQP